MFGFSAPDNKMNIFLGLRGEHYLAEHSRFFISLTTGNHLSRVF